MSKIPLADQESLTGELTKRDKRRKFVRDLIIGTVVVAVIAIIAAISVYFYLMSYDPPESAPKIVFHILADSFSISGLMGLLFYLMSYVSSQGAFDMLSYAVKSLFLVTFRKNYKEENFPKTYYDYKVLKDHEERKAFVGFLIPSVIFFVIGMVFLIIYYANL